VGDLWSRTIVVNLGRRISPEDAVGHRG
jgi:hypothetical protein